MDRMGRVELHYRALEGDLAGIKARLEAGDPVNATDAAGDTPLHFAAQQSQLGAVEALLVAGASVNVQDVHGNIPLWRAIFDSKRGGVECVMALMAAGADPDLQNAAGVSPRELAERMATSEVRGALG